VLPQTLLFPLFLSMKRREDSPRWPLLPLGATLSSMEFLTCKCLDTNLPSRSLINPSEIKAEGRAVLQPTTLARPLIADLL